MKPTLIAAGVAAALHAALLLFVSLPMPPQTLPSVKECGDIAIVLEKEAPTRTGKTPSPAAPDPPPVSSPVNTFPPEPEKTAPAAPPAPLPVIPTEKTAIAPPPEKPPEPPPKKTPPRTTPTASSPVCPRKASASAENVDNNTPLESRATAPPGPDEPVAGDAAAVVLEARPLYRKNPPPRYPQVAKRRHYEGTVVLEVLVSAIGRASEVRVLQSSGHRVLDQAALDAVRDWRFTPGRRGHTAVPMRVQCPVRFALTK